MKSIQTERLFLRHFHESDFDDIIEQIYINPEVYRHYSGIAEDREEVQRRFVIRCNQPLSAEFGFWAVELRQTRRVIGQVHLEPYVDDSGALLGESGPYRRIEVELAFAIGKAYWGQGYGYEACRAALDYAFLDLKLPRLVGGVRSVNERSLRLHRRLGYRIIENANGPDRCIAVLENDRIAPPTSRPENNMQIEGYTVLTVAEQPDLSPTD